MNVPNEDRRGRLSLFLFGSTLFFHCQLLRQNIPVKSSTKAGYKAKVLTLGIVRASRRENNRMRFALIISGIEEIGNL